MKRIVILALCAVVNLVGAASALASAPADNSIAAAIKKDPLIRFKSPVPNNVSGSQNVVIAQVPYDSLPPYMKGQADLMAACTGDKKNVELLAYYAYVSDYQRANKLSPSYIVDTSGFKDKTFSDCFLGDICSNGQCALIGYMVDIAGWTRSFYNSMYRWTIEYAPRVKEGDPPVMWIDILSMRDSSCEASFGSVTDEGCFRRYEWRRRGLSPVPISQ